MEQITEKALRKNGRVMVTVALGLPKVDKKLKNIAAHYRTLARVLNRHAVKTLLPSAIRAYNAAPRDFEPYALTARHTVTLHNDEYLSLYIDVSERADGLTVLERSSDTWRLSDGTPVNLSAFIPGRKKIAGVIPPAMKRSFRTHDFYLRPDATVLFWQPGSIEPNSHGIQELTIPK
jgi:hypothetical protein